MNRLPILLVPGAYHGAWCFEKLLPVLARKGYAARGIDLPLCPDRATPVSMEDCMAAMEAAIPAGKPPVLLCGHSNGGHFLSAFAQRHPERVAALVYITATLLPDGCNAFDLPPVENTCPKPRRQSNKLCKWYPVESEADFEAIWHYFYSGAGREEARRAVERLLPQPLGSVETKNHLTADRFGRVPRYYVLCTADRCMSPDLQRAMVARLPCRRVLELESGHSPFLTHPEALGDILCALAAEVEAGPDPR